MKKMKTVLLAFAAVFMMSQSAHGLVNLEPFIGYAADDADEAVFGGRVGFSVLPMVSAGVQANYFLDTENLFGGVYAMVTLPVLIRGWVGYDFFSDYENSSVDGKGPYFGVGFTGLPFISLNLEYHIQNFDDITVGSTTVDGGESKILMLTVGLPL